MTKVKEEMNGIFFLAFFLFVFFKFKCSNNILTIPAVEQQKKEYLFSHMLFKIESNLVTKSQVPCFRQSLRDYKKFMNSIF